MYAMMSMMFAVGCCGFGLRIRIPSALKVDDSEAQEPIVAKSQVSVGTNGFKLHLWVIEWFRSMFGYEQGWFVLIWELMIVLVWGMCFYGLWVNSNYSDKRYCAPSVWDTFYFHLLYILCFSLALFFFIAFTVLFVFNFSKNNYQYDSDANDEVRRTINMIPVPTTTLSELEKEYDRGPFASVWLWVDFGENFGDAKRYKTVLKNISYELVSFIQKNYNRADNEVPRQVSDGFLMDVQVVKS